MAQTERNPKSMTFSGSGSQAAEIASLRSSIQSGNLIYANDLNRIATLINNMNGHYHTYDDAYQLATFGNNGDRNNYYEDKSTNSVVGAINVSTSTAADTDITATRHNELRNAIEGLRTHYHGINDRTA